MKLGDERLEDGKLMDERMEERKLEVEKTEVEPQYRRPWHTVQRRESALAAARVCGQCLQQMDLDLMTANMCCDSWRWERVGGGRSEAAYEAYWPYRWRQALLDTFGPSRVVCVTVDCPQYEMVRFNFFLRQSRWIQLPEPATNIPPHFPNSRENNLRATVNGF